MTANRTTTNHILAARAFASPFTNFAAAVATTAALGLATFTYVMPAHAAGVEDAAPSLRVSYADLDLSTTAGQAALRHRVAGAINQVCGDMTTISDPLKARMAYDACRADVAERSDKRVAALLGERKLARR